jgi:hypothetical protein
MSYKISYSNQTYYLHDIDLGLLFSFKSFKDILSFLGVSHVSRR